MAYKAGLDYNLNYLTKNQNLMLRFASAFLLACTTAKKVCRTDDDCDGTKRCNTEIDVDDITKLVNGEPALGACDRPLDALVVELVGAGNIDADYPSEDIKGTIYLT